MRGGARKCSMRERAAKRSLCGKRFRYGGMFCNVKVCGRVYVLQGKDLAGAGGKRGITGGGKAKILACICAREY